MAGRRTLAERLKYRSLSEAAESLGLSPRQLKRRMEQGLLRTPMQTESGRYLFTLSDIEKAQQTLKEHPELRSL
jgi:DNA-binding transcriptional MerR regulator